jgi:hypothetical protein
MCRNSRHKPDEKRFHRDRRFLLPVEGPSSARPASAPSPPSRSPCTYISSPAPAPSPPSPRPASCSRTCGFGSRTRGTRASAADPSGPPWRGNALRGPVGVAIHRVALTGGASGFWGRPGRRQAPPAPLPRRPRYPRSHERRPGQRRLQLPPEERRAVRPARMPPAGRRGRKPTYGRGRISLEQQAQDEGGWRRVECAQYGERVTKTVEMFQARWRPAHGVTRVYVRGCQGGVGCAEQQVRNPEANRGCFNLDGWMVGQTEGMGGGRFRRRVGGPQRQPVGQPAFPCGQAEGLAA